ncbi:hypothetical protein LG293_16995 (plasmid) [Citricoccus nitrophenolicus]
MRVRAEDLRGLIRHEAVQAVELDHALSDSHSRLLAAVRAVAAQLEEDREAAQQRWDDLADEDPELWDAFGRLAATERSLAVLAGSLQSGLAEDVDKLFATGRWSHPEVASRRLRLHDPSGAVSGAALGPHTSAGTT